MQYPVNIRIGFAGLSLVLAALAFMAPPFPFIYDGAMYYDMARAMAERGALHIADNGGVEDAGALTKHLSSAHDGLVYPQYPSGYAFVAAPFYMLFGMRGLMLMNALSAAAALLLTFLIGRRLFDERTARWAVVFLALATFLPSYAFGVWPHALALAFWLGAFLLAIEGNAAKDERARLTAFTAAGLIVGAGVNIRVDAVLAAPALFFWLRLFARPHDRLAPLALLLGMAPGLLCASYLNALKFDAFTPFTYGPKTGADSIGRYIPLMTAGSVLLAIVWVLNIPAILEKAQRFAKARSIKVRPAVLYAALFIGGAAILVLPPARDFLFNLYVLVINLQAHNAYHQTGVEPDAYGHLLFWGYPKKALLQSLPYLPLIAIPVFFFFRNRHVPAFAICFLAIGAPVAFYTLNQWHGGGSYSMRYFMPALPFITLLSAWAFVKLLDAAGGVQRQQGLLLVVSAAILYLGLQEIGKAAPALFAPAALFPQWAVAAILSVGVLVFLMRPASKRIAYATLNAAIFAVAYAGAINIVEEFGHEKTRAEQLALARDASAPFSNGALIVTTLQHLLIPAEQGGAAIVAVNSKTVAAAAASAEAFAAAGRCVYFHNSLPRDMAAPYMSLTIETRPTWAESERFHHDPRLAFFLLSSQRADCAF